MKKWGDASMHHDCAFAGGWDEAYGGEKGVWESSTNYLGHCFELDGNNEDLYDRCDPNMLGTGL